VGVSIEVTFDFTVFKVALDLLAVLRLAAILGFSSELSAFGAVNLGFFVGGSVAIARFTSGSFTAFVTVGSLLGVISSGGMSGFCTTSLTAVCEGV